MNGKRILIVDDEPEIIATLGEILRLRGYQVDGAEDAAAALVLVRDSIYDAAIVDFNLPDMDGVMVHRQIRQIDPELAENTLFTSGYEQSEDNLDYYASYGRGFLAKPFDLQEVLDTLSRLWKSGVEPVG